MHNYKYVVLITSWFWLLTCILITLNLNCSCEIKGCVLCEMSRKKLVDENTCFCANALQIICYARRALLMRIACCISKFEMFLARNKEREPLFSWAISTSGFERKQTDEIGTCTKFIYYPYTYPTTPTHTNEHNVEPWAWNNSEKAKGFR